jgi:anti-sigma B factor antagonist
VPRRSRADGFKCLESLGVSTMELLTVKHEVCDGAAIVRAEGEIDTSNVGELRSHLMAALDLAAANQAQLIIVDLEAVTFFGSAGMNAVLDCHQKASAAGTPLRLVADNVNVVRPIEVTQLDSVLDIYPTLADALAGEADKRP